MKVICPECGADMVLRTTTKYKYKSGSPRKFYGCSRYPLCQAAHGADPQGNPLGIPANKETKQARIVAHNKFDGYWKAKGLHRNQAYKLLQDLMELEPKDAHIAMFNKEQCLELVKRINEREQNEQREGGTSESDR